MKIGELEVALLDQSKTDAAMVQLAQEKQVTIVTHVFHLGMYVSIYSHNH